MSCISEIAELDSEIIKNPNSVTLLMNRGKLLYKNGDFGKAMNDFISVLNIDAEHVEARQLLDLIDEIFSFRNMDLYNP